MTDERFHKRVKVVGQANNWGDHFDEENNVASYERSQTFGYIRALIVVMNRLRDADDTVWLNDYTTVFDECWSLGEKAGGLSILQKNFPEYVL